VRRLQNQRLLALFVIAVLLFNFPLLALWDRATTVFGLPLLATALFALWSVVLALLAWLGERADDEPQG